MVFIHGGTHNTRDVCLPDKGTQITIGICFPSGKTHNTRDMCFQGEGTHIARDMGFLDGREHISGGTFYMFLRWETYITRDMFFFH